MTRYKQDLGLKESVAIVISRIIGSGIFRVPASIMALVGCTSLFGVVWIIGGAITIFGAVIYAELSAMIHALRWVITQCPNTSITIRGDSMYALRITDGSWKAKENKLLANNAQEIWKETEKLVDIKLAHIKAHTGHRWNERADHLAFRVQSNQVAIPLQFWKPGQR